VSFACELQRDWNRLETVPQIGEIVLTERLLQDSSERKTALADTDSVGADWPE
jgi:hypothetical protein